MKKVDRINNNTIFVFKKYTVLPFLKTLLIMHLKNIYKFFVYLVVIRLFKEFIPFRLLTDLIKHVLD